MDLLENENDPNISSNTSVSAKNLLDRFLQKQPSEAVRLMQEKAEPSLPQTAQDREERVTEEPSSSLLRSFFSPVSASRVGEKKEKEEKRGFGIVREEDKQKLMKREIVIVDDDEPQVTAKISSLLLIFLNERLFPSLNSKKKKKKPHSSLSDSLT